MWVGGILEDQLPESKVGPLFQCLLIEQLRNLRNGDRCDCYYYFFFFANKTYAYILNIGIFELSADFGTKTRRRSVQRNSHKSNRRLSPGFSAITATT